jgi:catechol 2,3-dioxygenase-like lactoylglutathione lyase family enzyme
MQIDRLDHLVLTVADIERSCDFYRRVLGAEIVRFAGGRTALSFGRQKINLHQAGREFEPKALTPTPGSGDFCLIAVTPLDDVIGELQAHGVAIVEGPVDKIGAVAPLRSVYVRDPDRNLVEIANELRG